MLTVENIEKYRRVIEEYQIGKELCDAARAWVEAMRPPRDDIERIKNSLQLKQSLQASLELEEFKRVVKQLADDNDRLKHRVLVLETELRGLYAKLESADQGFGQSGTVIWRHPGDEDT